MASTDKSAELPSNGAAESKPMAVLVTLFSGWMIPGLGFALHERYVRGILPFVLLNLTFWIGVSMHGGVVWPVWTWADPGFNLVNNLTFIIQLGNGLPALLSLIANQSGGGGPLGFLVARPSHHLYDLSSFYLMVSGAMNYFVVCNTYDRLFCPQFANREVQHEAE